MTSLHPAILICWLILAASVVIVVGAICVDWWERRQDAATRELLIRDRHHGTEQ